MRNRKLKSALRAARHGFAVLPLYWAKHGRCGCGNKECPSVGKHPLTPHGANDATTDAAAIRKYFDTYPTANIGVATGKVSDLIVVDIDPRHGGFGSLKRFERENGALPHGPVVRTGGGGFHHYFKYSDAGITNKVDLLPGVDVRSDGGFVVYPPSVHESSRKYLWLTDKSPRKVSLPPFPESLAKLAASNPSEKFQRVTQSIKEGTRHTTLVSLAGVMRNRGMSYEAIAAALLEDNLRRCDPPLLEQEVRSIARSINKYAPGNSNILSSPFHKEEEKERKLLFRTGKEIAEEAPAKVPWIAYPWIAAGAITEIDGKVKVAGKSTFVTHMVSAVLNGSLFLDQPTTKTSAVYFTEQSLTTFRVAMERASLLGSRNISVLTWAETFGIPWVAVVREALKECKRQNAQLLIVDTLPQFAGLPGDAENLAGHALEAVKPLQLAAAKGLAIIIVRHERKGGGAVGDSGRGSSAFAGAVDIVVSVRRPEGNHPRNVRELQTVSRFDAPDYLLIELTDHGYRALGAPGDVAREQAAVEILSVIPESKSNAIAIQELATVTHKKRAHLQRLLDYLMETGRISKRGKGRKGSAYRYFKA